MFTTVKSTIVIKTIIFLLAIICVGVVAQDTPPETAEVIRGQNVAHFQWLPNEETLKIIDGSSIGDERQELTYEITSQPSTAFDQLLIAPLVETSNSLTDANSVITDISSVVTYVSPNGQLTVSAAQRPQDQQYYLTIQNLSTGQVQVILDIPVSVPFSARHFRVRWSEDSSAFYVFNNNSPATYWYYVSHFTHALEDTSVVLLNDWWTENVVNQAVGRVAEVFDIDSQGEILLLRRNTRVENQPRIVAQLVALNMKTLQYDIFITSTSSIAGARFGQKDQIYYINAEGLSVYSLTSDTSQLLDTAINSNWAITAEISYNGQYVAATKPGEPDVIYVIPVNPQ